MLDLAVSVSSLELNVIILRDAGSKLTVINTTLSSLLELKDTTFFPTCVDTFNFRNVLPFNIV